MNGYKVYLEASKLIANNTSDYACVAIMLAAESSNASFVSAINVFESVFEPQDYLSINYYRPEVWYGWVTEENQLARSLALLFMSEILKDKEL